MKITKSKKAFLLTAFTGVLLVFLAQCSYFRAIYKKAADPAPSFDVVLVYGGGWNRSAEGLSLADKAGVPIFVSDSFGGPKDIQQKIHPVKVPITVDHYAQTTDQNARNAARFLKTGGFRKAVLVTDWFHMPRALFLTRLYLLGSGVSVGPHSIDPVPPDWWTRDEFRAELVRFWGSLARAGLDVFGFEKPWFH